MLSSEPIREWGKGRVQVREILLNVSYSLALGDKIQPHSIFNFLQFFEEFVKCLVIALQSPKIHFPTFIFDS